MRTVTQLKLILAVLVLLMFGIACNFAGYLNLLPYFRSDGIHLLAHIRAARFRLQPSEIG